MHTKKTNDDNYDPGENGEHLMECTNKDSETNDNGSPNPNCADTASFGLCTVHFYSQDIQFVGSRLSGLRVNKIPHRKVAIQLPQLNTPQHTTSESPSHPLTANDALPNYPSTAEAVNAVT